MSQVFESTSGRFVNITFRLTIGRGDGTRDMSGSPRVGFERHTDFASRTDAETAERQAINCPATRQLRTLITEVRQYV